MIYLSQAIESLSQPIFSLNHVRTNNRQVSAVTVMEDPHVDKWLHGGEILLTNLETLQTIDNPTKLIAELDRRKVACLIIKSEQNAIDSEWLIAAQNKAFPLFTIDLNTTYLQIMDTVNELLFTDRKFKKFIQLELDRLLHTNGKLYDDDFTMIDQSFNIRSRDKNVLIIRVRLVGLRSMNELYKYSDKISNNFINKIESSLIKIITLNRSNEVNFVLFLEKFTNNKQLVDKLDTILVDLSVSYPNILIGISSIHRHNKINEAFKESGFALDFLKLKENASLTDNRVMFYQEVALWRIIQRLYSSGDFILNQPLVNLLSSKSSQLLKTLLIYFFNNESIKKTSQKMYTHPNTIRYRLNTIKDKTGLDYRSTLDKITLLVNVILIREGIDKTL